MFGLLRLLRVDETPAVQRKLGKNRTPTLTGAAFVIVLKGSPVGEIRQGGGRAAGSGPGVGSLKTR